MGSVLVTGAAGGLGRCLCHEFARRGYDMVLVDLDGSRLQSLASGLSCMHGVKVETLVADLTDKNQRRALCQGIESRRWVLSGLVSSAGMDSEGPLSEIPLDRLESILELNVVATTELMRSSIRAHRKGERLFILNIASLAAINPMPYKAAYSSSKRFLMNITRAVAWENKGTGITTTAFCPAGIPTNPTTIGRIKAQGFWGRATMLEAGTAARLAADAAIKGRELVIPGFVNRFVTAASALSPKRLTLSFIAKHWKDGK